MNTTFLRTTASMTLLLAANLAFADHMIRRDLEDNAFAAITEAREIRTEIRDHFDGSASYGVLMEEATKLYRKAIAVEESLLCGQPTPAVCREIDQTLAALKCFRKNLDSCDFAYNHAGNYRTTYGGNGYTFRPATRHAGNVHVAEVRQMLEQLDRTLDSLHDDIASLSQVRPVPVVPQAPLPEYPRHDRGAPGHPSEPFLPPPSASRPRSSFDVPVSFGPRGGIVFQIPVR